LPFAHCGVGLDNTNGDSSAATHPIDHRRVALTTADPFDRRALPSPFHEKRPAAPWCGKPSIHPLCLIVPKGWVEASIVICRLLGKGMAAVTRRCSFASVIDTTCELPNRCPRPRATCDWTPAGNVTNRCVSERLETAREDHPLPAVIWVYAAFPFSGRTSRRRYDEAPALDTSRHHAMGPASAETPTEPATTAITRSKDLRMTHPPRREIRPVSPRRLPSSHRTWLAGSIGDWALRREPSARDTFCTVGDDPSDATDSPTARSARTSALRRSQHPSHRRNCL